jgi:hypothetical protein
MQKDARPLVSDGSREVCPAQEPEQNYLETVLGDSTAQENV